MSDFDPGYITRSAVEGMLLRFQDNVLPYCEGRAMQAVGIAKTYFDNRATVNDQTITYRFIYGQTTFLSASSNLVNDTYGKGIIDCSTYMHLVLRGISYQNSPYSDTTASHCFDREDLTTYTNFYTWAEDNLASSFTLSNSVFLYTDGKLARSAADLAKYYLSAGRAFPYNDRTKNRIRPGDLIFFQKPSDNDYSFMQIHHVGMFSYDTTKYFNVTNTESVVELSDFVTENPPNNRIIAFIARPFYERGINGLPVPGNNYLIPPWRWDHERIMNHVIARPNLEAGTMWTGVETSTTSSRTVPLYILSNPLYLPPGNYRLSGAPPYRDLRADLSSKRWGIRVYSTKISEPSNPNIVYKGFGFENGVYSGPISSNTLSEQRIYDRGYGAEFTLVNEMWAQADIYINEYPDGIDHYSNKDINTDNWRPLLIRIINPEE